MNKSTTRASSSLILVRVEQILIGLALTVFLFQLKFHIVSDGMTRFRALEMLFNRGELSGMAYSIIGPLFSSPIYLIGKLIGSPQVLCAKYNFFLFVLGLFLINKILKDYLDGSTRRKFYLILILGSMFPQHLSMYFGEVFTAVLVGFGILAVITKKYVKLGYITIILGAANIPASAIGLLLVVLVLIFKRKRWGYALIFLTVIVIILAEAWIRRGSPFNTGYHQNAGYRTFMPYSGLPEFSYPFFSWFYIYPSILWKRYLLFCPGNVSSCPETFPEV